MLSRERDRTQAAIATANLNLLLSSTDGRGDTMIRSSRYYLKPILVVAALIALFGGFHISSTRIRERSPSSDKQNQADEPGQRPPGEMQLSGSWS